MAKGALNLTIRTVNLDALQTAKRACQARGISNKMRLVTPNMIPNNLKKSGNADSEANCKIDKAQMLRKPSSV